MSNFEDKIREAFESVTPDMKERLLSRIDKEERIPSEMTGNDTVIKRKGIAPIFRIAGIAAMFLIVFTVGILLGNFIGLDGGENDSGALANLYIDVNPSIELVVTETGTVFECIAANEDAEAIISDMKLKGVEVNTALNAIIGSMFMNGYLSSDSNSILISSSASSSKFEGLLQSAVDNVDAIMKKANLTCSIIAQNVVKDEKTEEMASANNVSVGKMALINKIVEELEDYSEDDAGMLAAMSVKELNLVFSSMPSHEEKDDGDEEDGEDKHDHGIFEIGGVDILEFIGKNAAEDALFLYLGISKSDVTELSVYARHAFADSKMKMVYKATFIYGDVRYEYEIDCLSAEISLIKEAPVNTHTDRNTHSPDFRSEPTAPERNEDNDNNSSENDRQTR